MIKRLQSLYPLTIKNTPAELYNEFKHVAEQHHRSINREVIVCLKERLFPKKISPEIRLANIQALRSLIEPNIISTNHLKGGSTLFSFSPLFLPELGYFKTQKCKLFYSHS